MKKPVSKFAAFTFSLCRYMSDYDATNLGGFKLTAGYISARPNTPAGRFSGGAPAPLYSATSEDTHWLAGVNVGRVVSGGGGGGGAAMGAASGDTFLKEQHLEQLFDVFEEASWHAGEMVPSAATAYDILGYSTSVAEAEEEAAAAGMSINMNIHAAHAASGFGSAGKAVAAGKGPAAGAPALPAMTACVTDTTVTDMFSCEDLSWAEGDLPLMSPMAMDATAAGAWDAVDAYPVKDHNGASGSGARDGNNGVEDSMEDGGTEEDGSDGAEDGEYGSDSLSDSPPLTPNGSIEPGAFAAHGPPSDKDSLEMSEEGDGDGDDASAPPSTPGGSGSGNSASAGEETDLEDLYDDEHKSGNGTSSDLATNVKTTGARRTTRGSAKAAAAAAPAKPKQQKLPKQPVANTAVGNPSSVNRGSSELDKMINNKNNTNKNIIINNNSNNNDINNNSNNNNNNNSDVPSASDVALVYAYYRERRAAHDGVALLPRFECPAPPCVRARAQLGGGEAEGDEDGDGGEAMVVGEDGSGGSGVGDGDGSGSQEPAAAEYQFVLGVEAVRRQQRERAARGEVIAAAARRRRRRACFNPAASKRRRKQQAAMEVAVTAPLTLVYEPFDASFLDDDLDDENEEADAGADAIMHDALDEFKVEGEEGEEGAKTEGVETQAAAAAGADSEWESDDDVPLATLAERDSSPEPTLAAIALAAEAKAAKAEAKAAKKAAKAEAKTAAKAEAKSEAKAAKVKGKQPLAPQQLPAPPLTVCIPAQQQQQRQMSPPAMIPTPSATAAAAAAPSVMRKVASAASVVLSRAHSLLSMAAVAPAVQQPLSAAKLADAAGAAAAGAAGATGATAGASAAAAAAAVSAPTAPTIVGGLPPLPLNPTTPRRRRTPRFGGDRAGSGSPRVSFLAGGSAVAGAAAGAGASRVSRTVKVQA
jgi:hypothetical protein